MSLTDAPVRSKTATVNGTSLLISLDGVIGYYLSLTPQSGFPIMPEILHGSIEGEIGRHRSSLPVKKEKTERFLWFVSTTLQESEKDDEEKFQLKYVDEAPRKFSIVGYEYRQTSPFFTPDDRDVGKKLMLVVDSGAEDEFIHSNQPVIKRGPSKLVTDTQKEWCDGTPLEDTSIRVMTYNILSNAILDSFKDKNDQPCHHYTTCPAEYLIENHRYTLVLKQLQDLKCSLYFLQEVDAVFYEKYLKRFWKERGYKSDFKHKAGKSDKEGELIAYDTKVFKLVKDEFFPVRNLLKNEKYNEDLRKLLENSHSTKRSLTSRPTILQTVILKVKQTGQLLLCANTHLISSEKIPAVKVLQALLCLRALDRVKKRYAAKGQNVKILFGGDFNSMPDSPIYELFTEGELKNTHPCWRREENLKLQTVKAPMIMECLTDSSNYTNYTKEKDREIFAACLDYIWTDELEVVRHCPPPPHDLITENVALPSVNAPSDHIPLICDVDVE